MVATLLIANRGEIAVRIAATAGAMGLETVGVFTDSDAGAMHVDVVDRAVGLGKSPRGYLDGDRIIAAAVNAGADAVHPGYGFLSEDPVFAAAVRRAELTYVGPSAKSIRLLGNKTQAKALAKKAGLPVLPGYHGSGTSVQRFAKAAEQIGYPVLVKAIAGGGGRGMRIVQAADQLNEAIESAAREAQAAFGDGRLFLEKYVINPRHIEVQIFADRFGNVVHLGTRDCSVQRRYQKIIEEAPAPNIGKKLFSQLTKSACVLALAAKYEGAGTVEFILDRNGDHYFLEMNTRLQVEHPVTEMVCGEDLVEWQLRVACGEPLPKKQRDVKFSGHAFEARLCAEDPVHDFLPSAHSITFLEWPTVTIHRAKLRIDTGFRQGDQISPHYDSLLAKLIVHADDRKASLQGLRSALAELRVLGPTTNQMFLHRIATGLGFAAGRYDTGLIARGYNRLTAPVARPADDLLLAVSALIVKARSLLDDGPVGTTEAGWRSPWRQASSWRLGGAAAQTVALAYGGETYEVVLHQHNGQWMASVGGGDKYLIDAVGEMQPTKGRSGTLTDDAAYRVTVGGKPVHLTQVMVADDTVYFGAGDMTAVTYLDPLRRRPYAGGPAGALVAPMPGRVINIAVAVGDTVAAGDRLIVLEAMKMEHEIVANEPGVISEVNCKIGDQVTADVELVRLAET